MAELALFLEERATKAPNLVGTMGILTVPNGSTNVVPGRCQFTLDIRATTDDVRDACANDVLDALKAICAKRGLSYRIEETMRAAAAPSAPAWQARWERAVESLGLPVFRMPSGAGHDAMKLHEVMPQAMLFVRGENAGITSCSFIASWPAPLGMRKTGRPSDSTARSQRACQAGALGAAAARIVSSIL